MSRSAKCTVCQIDNRENVDAELQFGVPYREVAARHHLSLAAVGRHAKHHLNLTRGDELANARAQGPKLKERVVRLEGIVAVLAVKAQLQLEQEPVCVFEEDDPYPFY